MLPLLLAVALVLRAGWWVGYTRVIENEGVEYVRLASNWFHGQGYISIFGGSHTLFPPFYPLLIGLVTPLAGSGETAARLVSLASGVALVWILYQLGLRLFNPTVAFIAGLLAAVHPLLIALSVSTYSEVLYLTLTTGATLGAVACLQNPSWRLAVLAGALVAMAYLTRPEGLVLGPLLAGGLVLGYWRHGRARQGARDLGAFVCAALLIAAPYMVWLSSLAAGFRWEGKTGYNSHATERIRAGLPRGDALRGLDSMGAPTGTYMVRDQVELLRRESGGAGGSVRDILANPVGRLAEIAREITQFSALGGLPVLVLAAIGLGFTGWWRKPEELISVLTVPLLSIIALLVLEWLWGRYLFPLVPSLVLLAAAGAEWIARRARLVAAGLIVLTVVQSARGFPRVFDLTQTRDTEMRVTGEWMRDNAPEREPTFSRPLIMGIRLAPVHYAEGEAVYLPWAEEERALRFVHRVAPDFVMLRGTEAGSLPYAAKWLKDGISDACAEPVTLPAEASPYRVWRWNCKQ